MLQISHLMPIEILSVPVIRREQHEPWTVRLDLSQRISPWEP